MSQACEEDVRPYYRSKMLLPVCTFSLHTTPASVSCTWDVCVGYYVTSATSLCLHRRCGPASTPGSGFQPPGPRDGAFLPFKPPSDTRHSGRSKPTRWGTNCRIMFSVWDLSPINHGCFHITSQVLRLFQNIIYVHRYFEITVVIKPTAKY